MRDRWYIALLKESDSTSGVDISWFIDSDAAKTGTVKFGSFYIGKHKIFKDLQYVVFDYESNKHNNKIISTPTRANIEELKKIHKSNVVVDKIIKVNIATKRQVLSTVITGTIGGEEFVWNRVETNSPGAGQTYIYFKDSNKMLGNSYIENFKNTLEELSDGTYKLNDRKFKVITYGRNYTETKVGPELILYNIPAKDIHRGGSKPAVIHYFTTNPGKESEITPRLAEFWEDGRHRFSVSTYAGINLSLIFTTSPNVIEVKADTDNIQSFLDNIAKQ